MTTPTVHGSARDRAGELVRALDPRSGSLGSVLGRVTPVDAVGVQERVASLQKRSIKKASKVWALNLAISMIDLTTLEGKDTPGKVRALCAKGMHPLPGDPSIPHVAAICVYPTFVADAKAALGGSGVKVASVATAFPSGQSFREVKLAEVHAAAEAGADEIDMVIDRGAFLAGQYGVVFDEIVAVKEACGQAHLKVILETGELETYDNIRRASDLAIDAGADAVSGVANRLGIAPIDIWNYRKPIYNLQGQNTMGCMSGPWIRPLAMRDVFEMRKLLGPEPHINGTGGIASMPDAVQMMMCGADTIGVCTETMLRGFGFLEKWMKALKAYMQKMGFQKARDMRDLLLPELKSAAELTLWAGYAKVETAKCSGCGACVEIGHCDAIVMIDDVAYVDPALCKGCSTCIDICPTQSIAMVEGAEAQR